MACAPQLAKTQLGRQEWLSIESAGYTPSALSVLEVFAAPTPCALLLMMAARSCNGGQTTNNVKLGV